MLEKLARLPEESEAPAKSNGAHAEGIAAATGGLVGASLARHTSTAEAHDQVDLVVRIVNREKRPIRAVEVAQILRREGHDVDNNAVANSLYYAGARLTPPRILKLQKRGTYAPLEHDPRPLTDYVHAGSQGFSVPDRLPPNDDPEGMA